MRKKLIFLIFIGICYLNTCIAQVYTISGYVQDKQSGEKIEGANIVDERSQKGTVSNAFGFFSLSLPMDSVHLQISFIGFGTKTLKLYLKEHQEVLVSLEAILDLETVEISSERSDLIEENRMSTIDVSVKEIQHTPTLLGESDVLKVLQLLPGVQSGNEGQAGLYVRGGSPDQNLILLDGVPVYNASHLFGFVSVFNSDAVKDVQLIKGAIPARYAGRISSIVDIKLKEGNLKEWKGTGSIGLVAAKVAVEGPIKKDTSALFFSARRSYIDILARPLIKRAFREQNGNLGYYFYDLNLKMNHKFSSKDRLYWSFYRGKDVYNRSDQFELDTLLLDLDVGLAWENSTSALRWNHVWGPKMFSNTTLTYSKYSYSTRNNSTFESVSGPDRFSTAIVLDYTAGIEDIAARLDFDFLPNPNHFLRFGGQIIYHRFNPGDFKNRLSQENVVLIDTLQAQGLVKALEMGLYVEDDWELNRWWKMNIGANFSAYKVGNKLYTAIEPRLMTRVLIAEKFALKASFAQLNQYVQLLTNEGVGLPTDLWLPTTEQVLPQLGWQSAIGLAHTHRFFELSLEGFYRKMLNVINYKAGASLLDATDWEDKIIQGDGEAYGLELFLRKKKGRLTGWLAYTLSWSLRQFDEINQGKPYFFRYDRRHDFSIVSSFELSEKLRISCNWVFTSGNPITISTNVHRTRIPIEGIPPIGHSFTEAGAIFVPERNNIRLSAYHRLDLGLDYKWVKKSREHMLSIGAYNLYNRRNPYYIIQFAEPYQKADGEFGSVTRLRQFNLFPLIPSLTYRLNWKL